MTDQTDIAFVKFTSSSPEAYSVGACWRQELPAVLAHGGPPREEIDLTVPADVLDEIAGRLAERDGPPRGITALVGNIAGGAWVTGPLLGEEVP